jgi:hypothetical protein
MARINELTYATSLDATLLDAWRFVSKFVDEAMGNTSGDRDRVNGSTLSAQLSKSLAKNSQVGAKAGIAKGQAFHSP